MEENKKYKIERIKSMSDLEALILLYDELISALEEAKGAWSDDERGTFQEKMEWAKKILQGLQSILNFDIDRQLALNISKIYQYLVKKCEVAQSEIRQTASIIEECLALIVKTRDAWIEVKEKGDVTQAFKAHLTSEDARFLNIEI